MGVKFLTIAIEYIVWILPIIVIGIERYKITCENGETRGIVNIVISLIMASVSVTIKEFLILNSILPLKISFLLGNSLILLSYVPLSVAILDISKELEKPIKAPKRVIFYLALMSILPIYASIRKEYIVSFDLIVYALLIMIIISIVGSIYILTEERKKNLKNLYSLFAISFILDFFLKGVSELSLLSIIQILKLVSFSIRGLVTLTLFLSLLRVSLRYLRGRAKAAPLLFPAAKEFVRSMLIAGIIGVLLFSPSSYLAAMYVKNLSERVKVGIESELLRDAKDIGREIQEWLVDVREDLIFLSKDRDIIDMNENYKDMLISYYLTNKNKISVISRTNRDGIIVFAYPPEMMGMDILNQPDVREILKTPTETISEPIKSANGHPVIIIHEPVFKNGVFDGGILALVNLKAPSLRNIITDLTFPYEDILVTTQNGTIVLSKNEDLLFKNINDVFKDGFPSGKVVESSLGEVYVVETTTRIFYDRYYRVFTLLPLEVITDRILKNLSTSITLIMLVVLSICLFIYFLFVSLKRRSERLEEIALKEYYKTLSLANKLTLITDFFGRINIEEDIKKFSENILSFALTIIRNGDAGSVLIKEGNRFVFKAMKGFDIKKLNPPYILEEEIVTSLTKDPIIIKNIYKIAKERDETKAKRFAPLGTDKIKSTIEAPFIVDGKFYGGLFIDSFRLEDAFSEEDLKLAKSISNLASLFLKDKLLTDSLKDLENKLMRTISSFSKIDIKMREEKFFDTILEICKSLIPSLDGGSILLKRGKYFEFVSMFGYKKEVLKKIKLREGETFITKVKEITVIKNVQVYDEKLPEETRDKLRRAGAEETKQTLVAPIIIDGEYQGGICLDRFSESIIFREEDLKVALALSKLSSVFITTKLAYSKLYKLSAFNASSISLFHKVNLNMKSEDIIKIGYDIISKFYPEDTEEIGILMENKGGMILTKFDGKNLEIIEAPNVETVEKSLKEKRSIFIETSSHDTLPVDKRKSQVVIYSNVINIPIVRIRFNKLKDFDEEEKSFLERFGHEIAILCQAIQSFKKTKNLLIGYVISMTKAIDSKDPYTEGHSERVAYLSVILSEKLEMEKERIQKILIAGLLHDVGKIGIPEAILRKNGKLSKEEYELVKSHTIKGEEIVKPLDPEIAKIVRHHHERWDGKGYPDGLKDGEIPLEVRILSVCDVFDALTSDRPYRRAYPLEEALKIMEEGRGTQFNPEIVDLLISTIKEIPSVEKKAFNIAPIIKKYLT